MMIRPVTAILPVDGFSALQRAEIAEIVLPRVGRSIYCSVSVLFNEPKLLKFHTRSQQ